MSDAQRAQVMPDEQSSNPKHPDHIREVEPSNDVSDAEMSAMLGSFHLSPGGTGRWKPPTPEELQREFPLYDIKALIGRGGMGVVYAGWHRNLHRAVAIKIFPPGMDDDDANYADRFQQEARAMAKFKHPGIVGVYDADTTPT